MSTNRGRRTLVLVLTLAVALATVGMSTPALAAPPSNDDFSNAEVINPDEVGCSVWRFGGMSLAQATEQPDEPAHHGSPADQSIWFTVTPPATGNAQLLLERNAPDALRVAAYEGATLQTLTPKGSMAVAAGTTNNFSFPVVAGEQISFAVDTGGSATARINVMGLRLPYEPHDNLTFATAREISGERGITPACSEGTCCGPEDGLNTWYRWTAPTTGFTSFGIGVGAEGRVYRGTTEGNLTLVAGASYQAGDGLTPEFSRVYADFWAQQGTTYHIHVNTWSDGFRAPEVLTWRPGTDLPNPRADFDRNGCEDLVVGAPGENMSGARDTGAVVVRYGCRDKIQRWHQDNDGTASTTESGDRFGHAVAAGDFDRDGFADLAVGVPGEDIGARRDTGTVIILRGSSSGLTTAGAKRLTQSASSGPLSRNEGGDRFGWALASRDREGANLVIGDGAESIEAWHGEDSGVLARARTPRVIDPADLFIGAPGEDQDGKRNTGTVGRYDRGILTSGINPSAGSDFAEYRPRSGGLLGSSVASGGLQDSPWPDRMWAAGQPGTAVGGKADAGRVVHQAPYVQDESATAVGITPRSGDRLGSALAMAELVDGWQDHLVVGIPGRDVGGASNAGMIALFPFVWDGPDVYTEATRGIPGTPSPGDRFGASLASGFFNTDLDEDLLVGVPGQRVNGDDTAGAVTVLYGGGTSTPFDAEKSRQLHRDSAGIAGDTRPGDRFGTTVGAVDLDGDTVDEILIGAPYDDVSGADDAGSVIVRRRNRTSTMFAAGLTPGGAEPGDQFGAAVLQ